LTDNVSRMMTNANKLLLLYTTMQNCILWFIKKRGSIFVIRTLEKLVWFFFIFLHCCKQEEHFTHAWKTCLPHLNNVLTLPRESETTASSVLWNIKFIKYRENKLTVTQGMLKMSTICTQACWPLVNCVINQRLLQASQHTQ